MTRAKKFKFDYNQISYFVLYLVLLLIVDFSKVQDLYGENYVRRIIHMFNRLDYTSYKNFLDPYVIKLQNFIDADLLKQLDTISINPNKDVPWLTRKNTGTHMYANMTDDEKQIMDKATDIIRTKCEKILNKKLYDLPGNINRFYSYYGNNSHHLWHVDPENKDSIYNVILCIKRSGEISPFQYKDEENKVHTIHTEINDGIFFRGGTTIHQVPPNDDPNSFRKVLALSFTIDPNYNTNTSLCTFLEGGHKHFNVIMLLVAIFIINYIVSYIAKVDKISYIFIGIVVTICILLSRYMPEYFDIGLGTGRPTSIFSNIKLYMIFILINLSVKRGALYLSYFILTELFFPRSWVFYY
jgi:hypothetical protein